MTQLMDRPLSRPKWRSPRTLIVAGVLGAVGLVLLLGLGLAAGARTSLRTPAASVTIETAHPGVFHDFTTLRAKVVPRDVVYLDSLEGGQVAQVLAQAGDVVQAGQPLVRFRNTELELEVLDREGRLAESITQLQAYEKQLEDARVENQKQAAQIDYDITRLSRDAHRYDTLIAKGYIPRQQYEATHDELDHNRRLQPLQASMNSEEEALRQRQLPEIKTELANLQASLGVARSKLDNLTLRAPVAGALTDMHLNVGEIKNRGERLGQIVPATGFKIEARVDEYYLDRVHIGQTGDVDVGGHPFALRVTRVDPTVKDATFLVELAFEGPSPKDVLPGQQLDGRLTLGGDRNALILPAGAFLERSGGDWVMVVDRGGHSAEKRRIKIGRRSAEQVEVLSGLAPGERVITSDYTGFEKIDRVVLTN
ncbi:MAG: efflux RND transporter periplasmic adaptor subunit [Phenylobacterium sp.]|nr:MAG: efflux RND transporter periplasmic adaptor subunit [Phenylobacterium sp.]